LVVDDDTGFRGLAARILRAGGLRVIGEAATCAAAMETALALKPDAILVDVRLPDGDGIQLARDLVALPWHPRVVLISSDADVAAELALDDRADLAFVAKGELPDGAVVELLSGR